MSDAVTRSVEQRRVTQEAANPTYPTDPTYPTMSDAVTRSVEQRRVTQEAANPTYPTMSDALRKPRPHTPMSADEIRQVVLWVGEGLPRPQIADRLGRPRSTLASLLHRLANRSMPQGPRTADPARPQARRRPCMTCQKEFFSEGFHNRQCSICRRKDAGPYANS